MSTQSIFMSLSNIGHLKISIDDQYIYLNDKVTLAKNDGFDQLEDFEEWFAEILVKEPDQAKMFKLIHWTDKRY